METVKQNTTGSQPWGSGPPGPKIKLRGHKRIKWTVQISQN